MDVSVETIRFLLKRSFGEHQLQILALLQRYKVITPTILVHEGLFVDARARAIALASQALKAMQRIGLLRQVARGHYEPTEMGAELSRVVYQAFIQYNKEEKEKTK